MWYLTSGILQAALTGNGGDTRGPIVSEHVQSQRSTEKHRFVGQAGQIRQELVCVQATGWESSGAPVMHQGTEEDVTTDSLNMFQTRPDAAADCVHMKTL